MSLDVLCDVRCELGEGPRWHNGVLTWVDIEGRALHRWDGSHSAVELDDLVGCANPTDDGDIVLALADRIELLETGKVLARFPHGVDIRANDGACDPQGRLWVGTMALDQRDGAGSLYRLDDRMLTPVLGGLTIANGIGWSHDETRVYYIDTQTRRIDVFDWDGELHRRRPFAAIDGSPDGLCLDDDGCVWVAIWGGGRVERWTPDGELDRVVDVPAENATACCFMGTTLVVTTAAPDGRIYVTDVGVSGPAAQPFRRTAPSDAEPTSAR